MGDVTFGFGVEGSLGSASLGYDHLEGARRHALIWKRLSH